MCILFMYVGSDDPASDYSLILAANRDESYDRPSLNMAPWKEDPRIIGGRDLQAGCDGGTWMAVCPVKMKIGVLLNLPRAKNSVAKTRGKIVQDYMQSALCAKDYVLNTQNYINECNEFIFVSVELGKKPVVQTYCNANNKIHTWTDPCLGFSNSLPEEPLKKVIDGRNTMKNICNQFNKISDKDKLEHELMKLLKSQEKHLPDLELQTHKPLIYEQLSSIFVSIPKVRYGTRTHTIILVAKTGHMEIKELTMEEPIDSTKPEWKKSEYKFDLTDYKQREKNV